MIESTDTPSVSEWLKDRQRRRRKTLLVTLTGFAIAGSIAMYSLRGLFPLLEKVNAKAAMPVAAKEPGDDEPKFKTEFVPVKRPQDDAKSSLYIGKRVRIPARTIVARDIKEMTAFSRASADKDDLTMDSILRKDGVFRLADEHIGGIREIMGVYAIQVDVLSGRYEGERLWLRGTDFNETPRP